MSEYIVNPCTRTYSMHEAGSAALVCVHVYMHVHVCVPCMESVYVASHHFVYVDST